MQVLLANGKYATIEVVETEELDTFETTYNFEVEDVHTYFVSSCNVLVHNDCPLGSELPNEGVPNSSSIRYDKLGKVYSAKTYDSNGKVIARIDFQGTPHYSLETNTRIIPHVHFPIKWINNIPKEPKYVITIQTYMKGL